MPNGIHRTAIVADGAALAEDVQVGPYCVIGPQARIGARTRLHSHVVIDGDTVIGEDCTVFPYAVLGTQPQDKKLQAGYVGKLRIGSHNEIREYVTVHGGTHVGRGVTSIGDHNMLLAGSHVGHDARLASHIVLTNGAMAAGHSELQDHVILGAMVGVHQFARVGRYSMIGAGAMLSHDAPPFALVQGDRARLVGVNKIGLARGGFDTEQITAIKRAYRVLFWRGGVLAQRIEDAREIAGDDVHVHAIIDFVEASERGICAPRGRKSQSNDEHAAAES